MALEIKCEKCNKFLHKRGALLLSPPAVNESAAVSQYHLCDNCYDAVRAWLASRGIL